jgi:hypothetical protein
MLISIDQTEGFNPDDYAAEEEKPQENLVPVSFAPMKMREDLSLGEEFGRGLDRGLLQTKGLGLGLVGALGEAAGLDDVEEYGYTGAQEAMQAASAPELAGEVESIFDVGSPGDFMHYAAGIMGSQVPNLAISAVTGGVGGMVGKRAVSAAITEALEAKTKQLMGEGVAKEVAKRQAQVALSREMGVNMVEKLAAEKAAQIAATKAGIGVGAAASGVGMEVGSIYSETRDLGLAVKYGVPAGLVEGITTKYFGGKIVDAIEGTGGKKGLMAAGREIGKGIGIEAGQEGVQTALELQALEESGVEPGFELFSKEGAKRVTEGAAAGAVMGGGMATGVQGLKLGLTPLTQRALQDVETGLPPGAETQGTEQQDTTDEEKFYNFSPDAVVIDDGDDDPITARRFTIGTETGWAIDNPTEEQKKKFPPLGATGKVAITDGDPSGIALKLILHNGGRVRNIDPSILDNKVADDEGEYVGLSSFTQDNKLAAGTGQQQGKVQGTDLEIDAEQRAFEDQLISKYSQLNNVLNATELLESTGVMPQGSFTGSEREALGGGLNQDERNAILAAVPSRELTKSKAQVERLIRETEEAAAKEGTTPELERQLNFLADVQGRIADFENLKTMQQTLGRKPLEGTAPGDLSAGVSKTDPVEEKLAEWSRIVDERAMALSDLFDTRAKLPKFENQDFEALDAYEMMLADTKNISDEMDLIREAAASAGGSIDPKMLAAKAEQLRQAEMAARELIDDGGPNDVFARGVREKLREEETKNSKAFDRWFNLNATAENLQDERNELVTQEDIENFDKSYKGKRLERISKVLDDAYDRVVPASVRSAIYEEAAQQARAARGDNEPAAAQRPAIEKELAQLDSKVEGINTRVVYKTPEGNTVVGTLVPDPETGKALDKNGNLVFAPNAFKVGKDSVGNDLTDLADTRPQYERFIRIPREYAGNIVEDKAAATNARAAREAEKLGVENAKQNTLVQNATAAAAKLNEQSEAREKELDASLESVFSKDPQGKWQSGVKRGDVVGLKLDDQGKVHRTEFLSDKTRLVPTNAGIYRGMENGEVVFDRYYIAKPKGGKAPKAPNSLALPQLRPGETFITLNDLDPTEIERLAIPTSERVPQDLWDNLYKAPKTAIFGTAQVPKGGMVQRPARRGTRMKQTPTIVEDETGDLEVQDVFTFEGDLTNPEEILTVALGKINMTPTREELMSAGFTPTGETQEFQVGRNYRESEVYDTTIKDPLSKSGLDIPVKAGLFKDSKNPDAPALVKLYAEFDPSDVYEAMEELEAKRTAPDTAQKNANIVRAEQSLAKAVQDLRLLTLAQMNMGLDVRVREINGIPEAQFLSDFGFVAERSGGKKGAIGNHIVTEVSYNPNPDFKGGGDTFRRKVQNPRLTQQRAAETLTNMTRRGRGFDAKQSGLGVANNVLGNFRRQVLETAQEAKEKEQAAVERGSDLVSRHAESLVRLTAFTRPMFERYAVAIRKHIEEAQGSTPEFKDRWLLEAELRLARELNKTQLRAMPASVVAEMQKQIKTKKRSAEKVKPVEGKRRVLKKGKNYGDLVDDPKMRGRRFQRATRTWKRKLDDKIDEVEEGFFRQMLPRAVSGNTGVSQVNELTEAIEKKKAAIRQSVAATKIAVKADQAEVAKQINNDQEVKRLTAAFQKSKGDAAKKRWKAKLDARKAQIENNAIVKRDPTEGEIETETRNKIQQNSEIRSLEQQLEKLGELSRDQEAMIDEFLDYIQARAEKTKNENRKALTQNLLTLLARKESALKGGRRMFVNVKKEAEKVEKTEGRRSEQAIRQEIKQRIAEDEEVKSLQRRIEQSSPKRRAELEAQIAERKKEIEAPIRKELKKNRVSEGDIQSKLEFELRKDETLKELQKELNESTPKWVEKLKARLNDAKEGIEEDVRREAATAGGFLAANEKSAAASEDRIDSAAKAMEFAQTTGNAKLFEKAAQDFTARAAKAIKRFSKADKRIIEAYGKMMDEVKTLNIFGTTGRVPGILRQGFNEAKEFQGAIEKQEFVDPQTGKALDIGSDAAGKILKGQKDPLAFENYREPRKKGDEKRQEYLEDLVARRFKELALARFDEFNEGDPNLANLVELALVKLFGGEFNGEVNGRSINKTFLPLPQKFVDPLIKFMEGGKGQTENQKIIREKYGELIDTYLLDYENDSFDLKKFEPDSPLNVPFGKRYGIASAPGANGTDVAQSNKNATAQPDRNPTREGSKAAVQSFVQGYAGLTDSDMVALDDREVDAIYQAATSKADADMAAGAVDSVVAATPGMDALLEMSGKDLMRRLLDSVEEKQARGDAETILRENLRRAATTKMFKSNTDFLDYVSKMPQGIKRATALRAREFLKLNGQGGFNWNKIATQIAAFGKDGKQATWAGLLGTDMESGGHAIFLNLDQIHEGDIVETMLEEMDHALTHRIINAEAFGMKLNSVQQSARDRLRTDFKRAVLKAGEGTTKLAEGARGLTPEQKVAFYSNAFKDMVAKNPDEFRAYYNLTNLAEFVVGIKKDGSFIDLLKELGFSEKAEGGFSISQLLKDIFTSLAELVTGRRLDANSELARAFSDAWTLSTGRDKTQWTVPPTQLSMALGVEATGGKATGGNETVRMRKEGGTAVYNAYLQQNEDGSWSVFGEFGDPTRKLQRAEKSKGKLDYEQAKAVFDKTVEAKSKKYSVIPEGPEGPQGPTGPNEGPKGPQGPTGPAPESAPGRRSNVTRMLLGKKEGTTYTGKKVETGGWFASDALATDGVTAMFDRKTNRESFGKQQAEFYDKALGRALKKYEGQFNPNDVNPALGNIENPLTEAQAKEIGELVATNQEADAAVLKNDYMEANRADFRRRQAEARSRLPEEIVKIIEEMRDTVDPLSSYADEKMGFSTAANEGIYLNRAYLIFGDEKIRELHQKQIRENPVVMENLKNYLSRQLAEQDAEALIRRATREGRILPREEALVQATANLSPTDLGAAIERVLSAGDKGVGSLFVSGRIPGQKNLKIFDARGNIAKEIQAAWGVVEDPGTNYANTVIKLANLVANDKFLQELKAAGLESGTLYDPRDPKNLNEEDGQRLADARSAALEADPTLAARSRFKPELLDRAMIAQDPVVASILEQAESKVPAKYVKLSGETNKSFAPVSGMYAEPLLFEWLTTKFPPRGEESWWMKALTQATLVPMAMKTVGSVTGQFRNYYSGYMSLLSNSNLRFWDPEWREDFKAAHRMTFGEIYRDVRGISTDATARKAMMKARERLSELGVTGQSVTMNFMQDLARLNSGKENGIVKRIDGLVQKFIQTYGASDDNFKIIHYFSELGKYRRAFPDMPQAQLEEKAAAVARGIHQTYGDTYSAVKSLKKVPFIAPFISFTSEVIRNTIYSGRLAWNEVKEGRATGNRELERIGLQRFVGMSFAGFGTFALTGISASLVGISGEEEREFRKLLPKWQRNSQLLFTGKENGKIRFADFSFSDPLSYLKTPAIAFGREIWSGDERSFNEKVGKGILNSMQTLASPFVSEQLFSGSLMQLYSNKDGSGREIVNWQDDPGAIAGAVGGHLIKPFIPGTFDSLGRIGKAFTGYVSPSGRSYDKGNEIMSFFGARISEVDVRQSLGFKTKAFMQNYREAAELFTGPFLSRGTQDSESIVEGYESANSAVQRLFGELRGIYLGAVRLGVPQNEVLSILKANGLSEENLAMLRSGKFKPYQASKQAITKNREAGMQTRISDYNKAYAAAQKP